MEHRWSDRKSIRVNVVMHGAGSGLMRGRTRDISACGAYVETGSGTTAQQDARVRVATTVAGKIKVFPGRVVRVTEHGFGVQFVDLEDEYVSALNTLIEESTARQESPRQSLPIRTGT